MRIAQILNRDLSICAVRLFDRTRRASVSQKIARRHTYNRGVLEAEQAGAPKPDPLPPVDETSDYKMPGMRILEALAASGLRSIRYFKEIPVCHPGVHVCAWLMCDTVLWACQFQNVDHIVVNDLSEDAVASIRRNVTFNGLDPAKVIPHQGDAVALMMQNRSMHNSFDVVDLDPYGTPNLFIDSAVQSVGDGGLICITATDTMTLCGANLDAAHAKYGSVVLKTKCCHEVALRTVLATVARHAAIYKRCIEPLISVSVDFYVRAWFPAGNLPQKVSRSAMARSPQIRMFVRVKTSAAGAKQAGTKQSMYFQVRRQRSACCGAPLLTWRRVSCAAVQGLPHDPLPAGGRVGQTWEAEAFQRPVCPTNLRRMRLWLPGSSSAPRHSVSCADTLPWRQCKQRV